MTELVQLIYETLSPVGSTHLEEEFQGAEYPYITFYFQPSVADFRREIFLLEVNVWDNLKDTTRLEQMVTDIDALLDRKKYFVQNVLATCIYRMSRSMVEEPDPAIRRRRLLFQCKSYLR